MPEVLLFGTFANILLNKNCINMDNNIGLKHWRYTRSVNFNNRRFSLQKHLWILVLIAIFLIHVTVGTTIGRIYLSTLLS